MTFTHPPVNLHLSVDNKVLYAVSKYNLLIKVQHRERSALLVVATLEKKNYGKPSAISLRIREAPSSFLF